MGEKVGVQTVSEILGEAAQNASDFIPADGFIGWVEGGLDGLGLMRGDYAILKRMGFGFALGSVAILLVKPDYMFRQDGSAREWSLFSEDSDSVLVPWYVFAGIFSLFFGVFI